MTNLSDGTIETIGLYLGSPENDEIFIRGKIYEATRANSLSSPPTKGTWVKLEREQGTSVLLGNLMMIDIVGMNRQPSVIRDLRGQLKTKDVIIVLPSLKIYSEYFGEIYDKAKTALNMQKERSYTANLCWDDEQKLFSLLKGGDAQLDSENHYQRLYRQYQPESPRPNVERNAAPQRTVEPVEVRGEDRENENTVRAGRKPPEVTSKQSVDPIPSYENGAMDEEWSTGVIVKRSNSGEMVLYNLKLGGVVINTQTRVMTINSAAVKPAIGMLARFLAKKSPSRFEPEPGKMEHYEYRATNIDYLPKEQIHQGVEQQRLFLRKNVCGLLIEAPASYDGQAFIIYRKGPPKERFIIAKDPGGLIQEPTKFCQYLVKLTCFYNVQMKLNWQIVGLTKVIEGIDASLEHIEESLDMTKENEKFTEHFSTELPQSQRSPLQERATLQTARAIQRFAGPNCPPLQPAELKRQHSPQMRENHLHTPATASCSSSTSTANNTEGVSMAAEKILAPSFADDKWKHPRAAEGWNYGICYPYQESLKVWSTSKQKYDARYPIREKEKVLGKWIEFKEEMASKCMATKINVVENIGDFPPLRIVNNRIEMDLELIYRSGHTFYSDLIGEVLLADLGVRYEIGQPYLHWFLVDYQASPAKSEYPRRKTLVGPTTSEWGKKGEYSEDEDEPQPELATHTQNGEVNGGQAGDYTSESEDDMDVVQVGGETREVAQTPRVADLPPAAPSYKTLKSAKTGEIKWGNRGVYTDEETDDDELEDQPLVQIPESVVVPQIVEESIQVKVEDSYSPTAVPPPLTYREIIARMMQIPEVIDHIERQVTSGR